MASIGLVNIRPLAVVCARATGSYEESSEAAWREMFAWLDDTHMRREVSCGFGLLRNDPAASEGTCRYDACVELLPMLEGHVPAGFRLMRLPAGNFARSRHVGAAGRGNTIRALRDGWLPSRALAVDAERPFVEIFLDDPSRVAEDKRRIDICIPVVRASGGGRRSAA
jgi:DNA gyrase inhibitor GyrI